MFGRLPDPAATSEMLLSNPDIETSTTKKTMLNFERVAVEFRVGGQPKTTSVRCMRTIETHFRTASF